MDNRTGNIGRHLEYMDAMKNLDDMDTMMVCLGLLVAFNIFMIVMLA